MDVSNYLWSIHEGHEQLSNDSRGRQEIFMCLAVLLWEQFCRFANGGAKLSIKSFMRSFFFVSVHSAAVKCQAKLLQFGVNCRLKLAGLGKKREETVKPTCFSLLYVESDFVTTETQTNHSQYSSPVEGLNLMIDSKSQPVELDMTFDVYFPGSLKPSSSICYILFSSEEKYFGALLMFHKIPLKLNQLHQLLLYS